MPDGHNRKIAFVYKVVNPNGAIYVGSTLDYKKRMESYRSVCFKSQKKLYASIIKFGFKSHVFEIVWEGDISQRFKKEREIGLLFNVLDGVIGLNSVLPGPLSDSVKRAISDKNKGSQPSEKNKEIIRQNCSKAILQYRNDSSFVQEFRSTSDAAKCLNISRTAIRNALNGYSLSAAGFLWRFKFGIKGKPDKEVVQINEDGGIVNSYRSIKDAARCLSISPTSIRYVLTGRNKTAAGFSWKLIDHKTPTKCQVENSN